MQARYVCFALAINLVKCLMRTSQAV
jgi:hypothetical protein